MRQPPWQEGMMKRIVQVALVAALLVGTRVTAFSPTISRIWGPPGELCSVSAPCTRAFAYPIRQGHTSVIDVEGQFVDLSTGLEVSGSGVTVSSAGGSSSHKLVRVAVSADAAPGVRTVTLHYAVELNGPDTFRIQVLRAGRVTSVTAPSPSQYFNDVDVTLHGTHLGNAGVFVVPETVGTFSVGGTQLPQIVTLTQSNASAQVVSSADSQTVVRVHFNGGPFAESKATLILYDRQISQDTCTQHRVFCYGGTDNSKGESSFHVVGPNAVSSITFPRGNSVRPGSPLTILIKLVRPAGRNGEVVRWDLVPGDSFAEAVGSGTVFRPSGPNSVKIPAGDQSKEVTVQYQKPPSGCDRSCTGKVDTRMVNFTVDALPFLRSASFTLLAR
jgi:hypothetical protein